MIKNIPDGFKYLPEYLDKNAQKHLIDCVTKAVRGSAPFFQGIMPKTGKPLSIVNSNFGTLGWVADINGYRYDKVHPKTKKPWPKMPKILIDIWNELGNYSAPPEACLINWYREGNKLGMHVDMDENDLNAPIISISLGDPARYRIGGIKRVGKTFSLKLSSGDIVVLEGKARKCYHGIDKIFYGRSTLVPKGGRINLTMRRVNFPG